MKIYAKQVDVTLQESPLFLGDEMFPDNIAVFGNRDYKERLPEIVDRVRDVLNQGELSYLLDNFSTHSLDYKNITEVITEYFPPINRKSYSTNQIHYLKQYVSDFPCYNRYDKHEVFAKFYLL